ncbi:MAG: 1-acyl-sn-glycerol-3-phosphate acyltransferase [Anaerolineales bacterium]|nr:1-acyl-sn-glycerol-3-phosphate acyltransferase [Anaerolineales bacterium]MCB9144756.1 1-acyl-sn-glycerol-3-phosphate acyltransferase [Anaerolineales bacterium]
MSAFLRFCARKVLPLIADIEVRGDVSKLPKEGGYMLASNHLGRLDSLAVYYVLDNDDLIHPLTDKYKKYWWGRAAGKIFNVTWLTRGEADMSAMKEFISRLKKGAVMVIAPEGTRSKTGSLLKAEPGAVYIASSAKVGIIPVALTGTEDAEVMARLKRFQKLKITISTTGEIYSPPDVKSVKGIERDTLLRESIDELFCRIAVLLPETYRGYYKDFPRVKELS